MKQLHFDFTIENNNVVIEFRCYNLSKSTFYLPHAYGGAYDILNDIKILESNVKINGNKIITSKNEIIIKYTFNKMEKINVKNFQQRCYHAIFYEDFFIFNSQNGLILPDCENEEKLNVTFTTNKPILISGIGKITKTANLKCTCDDLYGLMVTHSTKYLNTQNIILSYDPNAYLFINLKNIMKKLNKFIGLCNKLFDIKAKFVIAYTDRKVKIDRINSNGGGHYMGAQFFVLADKKTEDVTHNTLIYLAHEIFHFYNVSRGNYDTKWLTEGFTEFFCRLLLLSNKEFDNEVIKMIDKYNDNKYKNIKNSYITEKKYWSNYELSQLSYTKGFVYAYYLYKTQQEEFIERFIRMCKYYKKSHKLLDNKVIKKYMNDPNFDKYIIDGETIA